MAGELGHFTLAVYRLDNHKFPAMEATDFKVKLNHQ